MTAYSPGFYASQVDRSAVSAKTTVPLIVDALKPKSVLDIGCGMGVWPKAFLEAGVETAHGVDGPWVKNPAIKDFFVFDFEKAPAPYTLPLPQKRYDLVTSFEFVEHVGFIFSDALADLLCSLSDVLIIGGAIPNQGGFHHVNERWPDYWANKFRKRGYEPCDFIRPLIWDADVEPWYAQNTIAYFKGGAPESVKELAMEAWASNASRSLVHPGMWDAVHQGRVSRPRAFWKWLTLSNSARTLPSEASGPTVERELRD